jgi:hypothetical protein
MDLQRKKQNWRARNKETEMKPFENIYVGNYKIETQEGRGEITTTIYFK